MKTVFQILGERLTGQDLPLLLIGGFALQKYGVSRQTFDVDCLLADNNKSQLDDLLTSAGYTVAANTENFSRYTSSNIYHMDIDILFVDMATFEDMLSESASLSIDDVELRVPSLRHLIALKLHAMKNNPDREAKDILDISELLRENPDAISKQDLVQLCGKYGTDKAALSLGGLL